MLKIGKKVYISNNLNYQLYEANLLEKGDIAILISYSGETEKILTIAESCKSKNIPMIIITSLSENSLSKYSNCKLFISTKEQLFHNIGNYSVHLSVYLILDILYSIYFLQDYDKHYKTKLENLNRYENSRTSTNFILNDKIER